MLKSTPSPNNSGSAIKLRRFQSHSSKFIDAQRQAPLNPRVTRLNATSTKLRNASQSETTTSRKMGITTRGNSPKTMSNTVEPSNSQPDRMTPSRRKSPGQSAANFFVAAAVGVG